MNPGESRRAWAIFALVQVVGLGCAWLQRPAASSFLWGAGFVLLFPGDLVGAWIMERLFWHSRLPLATMSAMSAVLMVAINALLWWMVARGWKAIRAVRSDRQ
jgi:hypothetical protein